MSCNAETSKIAQMPADHHASFSTRSCSSYSESSTSVDYSTCSRSKTFNLFPSDANSNLVGCRATRRANSDTYVGRQPQSVPSRAIWKPKKPLLALLRLRRSARRALERSEPSQVTVPGIIDGNVNVQILYANLSDTKRDLGMLVSAKHNVDGMCQVQESAAMLRSGGAVKMTLSSGEAMPSCQTRIGQGSRFGVIGSSCGQEGCTGYHSKGRLFIREDDEVPAEGSRQKCVISAQDMVYQKPLPGRVSDTVIDARRGYETRMPHLMSTPSKVRALTLTSKPATAMAAQTGGISNGSSSSPLSNRSSRTDSSLTSRKTTKKKNPKSKNVTYSCNREMSSPPPRPGPAPMRPLPSLPAEASQNVTPMSSKAQSTRSNSTGARGDRGVEHQPRCSSVVLVSSTNQPSMTVLETRDISRCSTGDLQKRRRDREEKVRTRKLRDIQAMRDKMVIKTGNEWKLKRDVVSADNHTSRGRDNVISSHLIAQRQGITLRRLAGSDTSFERNSTGQTSVKTTKQHISEPKHSLIRLPETNPIPPSHHSSSSEADVLSNQKVLQTVIKSFISTTTLPLSSTPLQPTPSLSLRTSKTPSPTITKLNCASCTRQIERERKEKQELQSRLKSLERKNAELERTLMGILQQQKQKQEERSSSTSTSSPSLLTSSLSLALSSPSESAGLSLALVQSRSSSH